MALRDVTDVDARNVQPGHEGHLATEQLSEAFDRALCQRVLRWPNYKTWMQGHNLRHIPLSFQKIDAFLLLKYFAHDISIPLTRFFKREVFL